MPTPKKPTKLKILQGTARKDRMIENEPDPENKTPSPPGHLNETAVVEWRRISAELFNLGLLSEIDRSALAGYCEAYSLWVEACEFRSERSKTDEIYHGMMEMTANGNVIQSPIIGIINQTRKAMKDFLIEFGMTPSSRSRVSGKDTANKTDVDNFTTYKKKTS